MPGQTVRLPPAVKVKARFVIVTSSKEEHAPFVTVHLKTVVVPSVTPVTVVL